MFDLLTQNLKRLGYAVSCFSTAQEAVHYLNREIDGCTVGFGGSVTLEQLGLFDALQTHNTLYWHQGVADRQESDAIRENASRADIYLSSVNAIAQTGEIVNIDGACNRISAILYGHKKVYLVAGRNKVCPNYDSALHRARNVAAPQNARRLGRDTPCAAKADKCYDCRSPQRICRGLSVLWTKPSACEYEVVLIDGDLGY